MGGEPRDPERVLRDPGRLAALRFAGLLDTEPEEAFDRLTRLAARLLGVPVSLVSLVDERRHFFKSQVGLAEPWASARATPLSHSFCPHAVVTAEPLVITDARVDERVRDSPAVGALGLAPGGKVFKREEPDEPLPGAASVRDGVPRWFRSREELLAAFPAALGILHGAELEAAATVPFPSGAVCGFLSPHWAETRAFSSDDRALLTTLARLCAQALERARAYDEEHRVAETLQRSLLPKRIPPVAGMAIGVRYVPAGPGLDVGGDWYDVLETADGHLLAVVGDVVGHGLEAAASMGQIRNALRAYALEGLGPGDAVARTSALVQAVGQGEMTTAAVVRFDPATRSLRYTCAGHPPPLVISPDGEVVRLEGGRTLPLGVAPLVPDEASATVPDGATLLLYTDGLVERRGSSLDAGIARLSETAAAAAAEDVDALLDQVLALAGESRSDDVALLALRPLPVANEPLALRLPADPASLVHLRRSLRAYLERAGLGPEETYDVVLACSEAAANAIEHGTAPPAAEFAVRAEIVGGELRVAVTDSGRWRPPRERGRGRGLPLMRALMETVDVETGAGGTEVRMRRCLLAGAPARRGSAFRA